MADIPNTEYITVKRDKNGQVEIFVGWRLVVLKPATIYRGVKICDMNYVKDTFAWIQEQNPNIAELHVMSSKTWGNFAMVGNPSFEQGENAWCRVKKNDGKLGDWVSGSRACANLCALNCARYLRAYDAEFRRAVLVTAFENDQNEKNAQSDDLGYIDWSQRLGVHNVGPYEIIVRKTPEKTKKELKMAGKVVKFTNCDNVRHTVECCNNDVRYTCPYLKFLAEQEDYTDYYVTHAGETVRVELNFWQHSFAQNFPYPKAACASCMYNSKNRGR